MSDSGVSASGPAGAGAFPGARTVFRVRGVPVRVDASWFVIAGLALFYLYQRVAGALGGRGTAVVLVAAGVATLLLFGSILAHEVGHAVASLDRGIPVTGITLFLMGGVTESTREAPTARAEFVTVGIGPFISLVLAAVFGLVRTAGDAIEPVALVAGYLAWLNLGLAVFNVLPAYPLDGGRMLRALLWQLTGRPHRATRWAARIGQVFAVVMATFGVVQLVSPASSGLGGLGWVLLGVFLFRGAADSHRFARTRERYAARTVRAGMGGLPEPLAPGLSLAAALRLVQERPSVPWPVGAPLTGILTIERIDAVAAADWASMPVSVVMMPLEGRTVTVDTPMDEALTALEAAPEGTLVVVDGGYAVGLLSPSLVGER